MTAMSNSDHIDPQLRAVLAFFPDVVPSAEELGRYRQAFDDLHVLMPPTAPALLENCSRTEQFLPRDSDGPPVRVLIYRPQHVAGILPAFLHIHGGGMISGTADMMDASNRAYALDMSCVVLSVDYRLSPETKFPGAIEDCFAAFCYLHAAAGSLAIDPARIVIGGESAGAGLAAALALLVRDRQMPKAALQYLIAPMLDDRTAVRESRHVFAGEHIWTHAHNRFAWQALLNTDPGSKDVSAYASPARAEDVGNLPGAFIHVGALDLFAEECFEYARRLMIEGTPVELHVWPGAYHSFEVFDSVISAASRTVARAALKRALHP
jgi:acetyl esterase/lipase